VEVPVPVVVLVVLMVLVVLVLVVCQRRLHSRGGRAAGARRARRLGRCLNSRPQPAGRPQVSDVWVRE
jgi:hypothetical protein